jgi:hypothetical protein
VFGGTNFSLTLTNLQTNNTGGYTLVVTNAYGAATSSVATLAVALPPQFGNLPAITSSNIILTVTGGLPTSNYVVLAATNPARPVSQWTRLATNNFDNGGNFSMTNSGLTGSPQQFYRLQLP